MKLFKTNDGVALNYRSSGEGKVIVMLHTSFDNLSVFHSIVDKFSSDYQVILVDLRGHGYSDKPLDINFTDYIEDIKALLDYLYIDQCAIIGHEMGASIAVGFAAQYPKIATALTLINPTLLNDMNPAERLYKKYAYKIRNWNSEAQQNFLDKHLYYSKHKVKKFLKQVEDTNDMATKDELTSVRRSFNHNHIMHYLDEMKTPTQIIVGKHGERTTVLEAKEVSDMIDGSTFEVFTESGLYPFVEEKTKFVTKVKAFIKNNYQCVR
ncbi:alpha/beta hydrolase [Staphylococcus sp. ACRSN]|uniref:alpha/beta fold hydrolase n=1 Tax=Staphylococcus sp. ACRSN TaxID=2918214 RepID=UPI001EF3335A|nr:alpha/beta hydrolase [Staphylococcus sp. ACRSN]MCG7339342.1 alpha/beta hydrolase [Staphylococcus sp. ACRSN]